LSGHRIHPPCASSIEELEQSVPVYDTARIKENQTVRDGVVGKFPIRPFIGTWKSQMLQRPLNRV
jgi:hypothetical protein